MAAGLMMMTTAQANEVLVNQDNLQGELTRYRNAQPVLFALNNVDYAVFPDGRVELNYLTRDNPMVIAITIAGMIRIEDLLTVLAIATL